MKGQIKEEKEQIIHSIKKSTPKKKEKLTEKELDFYKIFKRIKPKFYSQTRTLTIPEPKLPPNLQYLKPVPRNIKIDLEKLPIEYHYRAIAEVSKESKNTLPDLLSDLEIKVIKEALEKTSGNKNKAADLLGIPISTLRSKIEKYFL